LTNRTFIMALAFVAGLIFSDAAGYTGEAIVPALIIVFTVSITRVSLSDFFPLTKTIRPVATVLLLNYLLNGALMLSLAWWLLPQPDLWIGYVLVAAAPPGIAVIPFTHMLKGDVKLSLMGIFGTYLLSIVITPAVIYFFAGGELVSPVRLLYQVFQLILIPVVLSQLLSLFKVNSIIDRWRGTIINWGFFIVIFSAVGLNRDIFLNQPQVMIRVSAIAFISSFFLAFLVYYLARKWGASPAQQRSYMLLTTIKTSAFSVALALALFNQTASVPGAAVTGVYALYFVFLGFMGDRIKAREDKDKTAPV